MLSQKITTFYNQTVEERENLGEQLRVNCVSNFSLHRFINAHETLYLDLKNPKRSVAKPEPWEEVTDGVYKIKFSWNEENKPPIVDTEGTVITDERNNVGTMHRNSPLVSHQAIY